LLFSLISFLLSWSLFPSYIKLLRIFKAGKSIRDEAGSWWEATIFKALHTHKAGTPTMGGALFLLVMAIMVAISFLIWDQDFINNHLFNRNETYILLFALFSMGGLGLIDDIVNIQWKTKIKWLSAKLKLIWMFLFSAFISWWFYTKLGVSYVNFRPIAGLVDLGWLFPVLSFFFTIAIVNAINITDGLDGLVGGMSLMVLWVLAIVLFMTKRYLATTIVGILTGSILAFLWFNIHPAKIFMGDAGALWLWWVVATLVYMINLRFGIFVPFMVLFLIFWIDFWSSALQLFRKKFFKKKLFPIAPFHHLLEHQGEAETSIVMKFRLLQGVLGMVVMIGILYQWYGVQG
jgi:phospho-N-acetylmuramoyl-pentapeptide-transferase